VSFGFTCEQCGKQFMRDTRTLKGKRAFCSRRCYWDACRVHPVRTCEGCGTVFDPLTETAPGRRPNPARKFCTRECYEASRANTVTKTCPVCGEDFTVKACIAYRYKVCSRACQTATTVYVDCGRCGKRFANTDPKRLNRYYCSEECRRPPMYVTCRHCGKRFREVPSMADRQFCSLACRCRFRGETRLEASVRVALEALGVEFTQEYPVGRWSIDFALAGHRIAIEADGEYWHTITAERDVKRDAELERGGWKVVRLPEAEVNGARDLGKFIRDRVREVTGLDLADLASPERRARAAIGRQLTLWDDDETAA